MDALVDLTGGLAERYEIRNADPNMYRHLLCAHRAGAFIACSRKVNYSTFTLSFHTRIVDNDICFCVHYFLNYILCCKILMQSFLFVT